MCRKKECLVNVAAHSLLGMEGKDSFSPFPTEKAVDQG